MGYQNWADPATQKWSKDISMVYERKKAEDELKEKIKSLELFQKATVDRELKMVELKKEIEELRLRLEKEG
jgi:uncharacterized protein (DUF849 family)